MNKSLQFFATYNYFRHAGRIFHLHCSLHLSISILVCTPALASNIQFEDVHLEHVLLMASSENGIAKDLAGRPAAIDTNQDGIIQSNEASQISQLHLIRCEITSAHEINHFIHLTELYCQCNQLASLDISQLRHLKVLCCFSNRIETLQLPDSGELNRLYCRHNLLRELDVSSQPQLELLDCCANQLQHLHMHDCRKLVLLYCSGNQLESFDIQTNTALKELFIHANKLQSLDLRNGVASCMENVYCELNPELKEVCIDEGDTFLNFQKEPETTITPCNVDTQEQVSESIEPKELKDTLLLFPNPAESQIYFSREVEKIEILDLAGKLVWKQEAVNQAVPIAFLENGLYLVVALENGKQEVLKLVIDR